MEYGAFFQDPHSSRATMLFVRIDQVRSGQDVAQCSRKWSAMRQRWNNSHFNGFLTRNVDENVDFSSL